MLYVPDTDVSPLQALLGMFGLTLPEDTHATFIKINHSGVEVCFYYADGVECAHRYKTHCFAVDTATLAFKMSAVFGFDVANTCEIRFVFELAALSKVYIEKDITENQMVATVAAFKEMK